MNMRDSRYQIVTHTEGGFDEGRDFTRKRDAVRYADELAQSSQFDSVAVFDRKVWKYIYITGQEWHFECENKRLALEKSKEYAVCRQ